MGEDEISNLVGNVRIVSETRTNSLLVTTSETYFEAIKGLIDQLDEEIPQVLVEILIVEIMDADDQKLGIDWPDNIPVTVEASLDAPVSGINLDRASILSTSKFSAVLDILASDSRTHVLARPNILTSDNQSAFVEVITRVPGGLQHHCN